MKDPLDPGTADVEDAIAQTKGAGKLVHRPNSGASTKHVHGINPDAANRPESDFYKTPPVATERFLDHEQVQGPCWEPACGDGAISKVLESRGVEVRSTDLYDHGYGTSGVDFLTCERPDFDFRTIITNPPFKHARAFAERALSFEADKTCLLMRLLWLEGSKRRSFFADTRLTRVWVHSSRVNVARRGQDWGDGGLGGMVAFAWYVWEKGHVGPPTLGWLP